MSVPDFQSLMLPILKFAGDGKEHSQGELKEAIAGQLQLEGEGYIAPGRPWRP